MADSAPLWAAAALPLLLAPAALAVACADGRSAAPVREVLRLLVQQPRRTRAADALATRTGTVLLPLAAVLAAAVVPLGATPVSDLGDGVVWFNAMEALAWAAVWLTGWGPNSTLSLVGGYRFLAQGLAYEIPHMLALTTAALGAGSLRVTEIADAQRGLWFAVDAGRLRALPAERGRHVLLGPLRPARRTRPRRWGGHRTDRRGAPPAPRWAPPAAAHLRRDGRPPLPRRRPRPAAARLGLDPGEDRRGPRPAAVAAPCGCRRCGWTGTRSCPGWC